MSNISNGPPPQKPTNSIYESIKELLNNSLIKDLLRRLLNFASNHVLITIFVSALLFNFTGYNLAGIQNPIDQTQICQRFEEKINQYGNSEKIVPFTLNNNDSNDLRISKEKKFLPFGCEYTILKQNGDSSSNKLYIDLRPLFYSLVSRGSYNEKEIPKKDLDEVICNDERTFISELTESGIKTGEYNINPKGAVLLNSDDVYPVFRWTCKYEISRKRKDAGVKDQYQSNFEPKYIGLDLDNDYCDRLYREIGLIKATYHDYNDPYSWYCTQPRAESLDDQQ
jgi:hypothetical protein